LTGFSVGTTAGAVARGAGVTFPFFDLAFGVVDTFSGDGPTSAGFATGVPAALSDGRDVFPLRRLATILLGVNRHAWELATGDNVNLLPFLRARKETILGVVPAAVGSPS